MACWFVTIISILPHSPTLSAGPRQPLSTGKFHSLQCKTFPLGSFLLCLNLQSDLCWRTLCFPQSPGKEDVYSSILHTAHGYVRKGTYLFFWLCIAISKLILHSVIKLSTLCWGHRCYLSFSWSLTPRLLGLSLTFFPKSCQGYKWPPPPLHLTSHSCGFILNVSISQSCFNSANIKF